MTKEDRRLKSQDFAPKPNLKAKRTNIKGCPIKQDAEKAIVLGEEMSKAMRRLRRNLVYCQRCEEFGDCLFRQQFNDQVEAVIAEINEEWGRT